MKTRLTPHYNNLVQDACLKSFWRKRALMRFLKQCGVEDSMDPEETKRDFLDRLFLKLIREERGRQALYNIAEFIIEQTSFPDLENWEDSTQMIAEAQSAVTSLKSFHTQQQRELEQDAVAKRARNDFAVHQAAVAKARASLETLSSELAELATGLGTQGAGYKFEHWFYGLLQYFEVSYRLPYKIKGRQIDGSLTTAGTTYLVELKFTQGQTDAAEIDSFHKKVTSKADNTMGIMVSMSGYSSVAIQEASGDRTPLLLLDSGHIYLVLSGSMTVEDLIARARRHASQTGEAFLRACDFSG